MIKINQILGNQYKVIKYLGKDILNNDLYKFKCLYCGHIYSISEDDIYKVIELKIGCDHNQISKILNCKYKIGDIINNFEIIDIIGYTNNRNMLYTTKCINCGVVCTNQHFKIITYKNNVCNNHYINGQNKCYTWKIKRIGRIYRNMIDRCYNKNCTSYPNYGGRGIKICEEWYDPYNKYQYICKRNFEKWSLENGYQDGFEINRKDPNKGYCPENCEWVTKGYNSSHDKRNITEITIVDFNSNTYEKVCLSEISRRYGYAEGYLHRIKTVKNEKEMYNKIQELLLKNPPENPTYIKMDDYKFIFIDFENNNYKYMSQMELSEFCGYSASFIASNKSKNEKEMIKKLVDIEINGINKIKHKSPEHDKFTIVDFESNTYEVFNLTQLANRYNHANNWLTGIRSSFGNQAMLNKIQEMEEKIIIPKLKTSEDLKPK